MDKIFSTKQAIETLQELRDAISQGLEDERFFDSCFDCATDASIVEQSHLEHIRDGLSNLLYYAIHDQKLFDLVYGESQH